MTKATLASLKAWHKATEEAIASLEDRIDEDDNPDNQARLEAWEEVIGVLDEVIPILERLK